MTITFKQITPAPLAGVVNLDSQIWETEVNFEPGKYYQVYAPSGKGKSTFLGIIYGIRKDFTGDAFINNQSVKNISPEEWARIRQQEFSIVFQDLRLFMDLTARQNIEVKEVLYPDDFKQKVAEMAEYLGVTHVLDKKAALLSYGERQRIAIIRSLVQPFNFLLLDEPFSHLDEENIKKACHLIERECKERNASIIMTSLGYSYHINFDNRLLLG